MPVDNSPDLNRRRLGLFYVACVLAFGLFAANDGMFSEMDGAINWWAVFILSPLVVGLAWVPLLFVYILVFESDR